MGKAQILNYPALSLATLPNLKEKDDDNLPELEPGDHLTRYEFHRRYEAMPHLKKAELIEGIVYIVPRDKHSYGVARATMAGWSGMYHALTDQVDGAMHATVMLDGDNEVQPDILLRMETGVCRANSDDYLEGAPDLIIEVAASSVSYELHAKKKIYRRNGVKEYIVWRVKDRQLDWFVSQEGAFVALNPDANGIIESMIFPGLRLAVQALLDGDMPTVLAELQKGIASPAHQTFVELLQSRKTSR